MMWRALLLVLFICIGSSGALFVAPQRRCLTRKGGLAESPRSVVPHSANRSQRRSRRSAAAQPFVEPLGIARKTPLTLYREYSNLRLESANACLTTVVSLDPPRVTSSATASPSNITILHLSELLSLSSDDSALSQDRRKRICERIRNTGGYCVVRLDHTSSRVLQNMWDSMERLFQNQEMDQHDLLRGFTLADAAAASSGEGASGYIHVQTQLLQNQLVPHQLKTLMGTQGMQHAQEAFQLLAEVGIAFATIAYCGSTDTRAADASRLWNHLLTDEENGSAFSGTYHRLCQYVPGGDAGDGSMVSPRRLLRSHCDWTLATPIPVSAVSGLEVHDPRQDCWIRIEQVLASMIQPRGMTADNQQHWNWHSEYVVVMAGSWLELLTRNRMPATVHRVVSCVSDSEQRKSAPFFLRPKESLFREVDEVFNQVDNPRAMDYEQAIEAIGDFLVREKTFINKTEM